MRSPAGSPRRSRPWAP
uniref:Uncharacterized protein n=1 Tax=Arundo donax TaxID=35708 RepID=A0A0A9EFJ3_ARUDO